MSVRGSGELPLPPYLGRTEEPSDRERYQTVYAQTPGSSAAPTAGLHFTPGLLDTLRAGGVRVATVTLHVGLGTFRPLRSEDLDRGTLHTERIVLPEETARAVDETRRVGGRVVAVGTTSARTLEARADGRGGVLAGSGSTDLFLHPPMRPEVIDGLITNFHLPRSSLLMLVATLVGRERLLQTYELAKAEGYRFYSYGDAMLLL
jgi:S-adenosylmethionine:tRNA ribosyltransferase-isomerase